MDRTIVCIEPNSNGFHNNQSIFNSYIPVPEGWAVLPSSIATSSTEYYPFAIIETEKVSKNDPGDISIEWFGDRDEIDVVTSWTPITPPSPSKSSLRTNKLYKPGEIFTAPDGRMYEFKMAVPANGAIAVGTNCEVITFTELLEK